MLIYDTYDMIEIRNAWEAKIVKNKVMSTFSWAYPVLAGNVFLFLEENGSVPKQGIMQYAEQIELSQGIEFLEIHMKILQLYIFPS